MKTLQFWIAEDDAEDIEFFKEAFRFFPSLIARFFPDALCLLKSLEAGDGQPDIILTDLRMPVFSGLELVTRIRRIRFFETIRLFILSSGFTIQERTAAAALSVSVFEKPSSFQALLNLLQASAA